MTQATCRRKPPGAYHRGWRDGYEAARREFMDVLRSMGGERP